MDRQPKSWFYYWKIWDDRPKPKPKPHEVELARLLEFQGAHYERTGNMWLRSFEGPRPQVPMKPTPLIKKALKADYPTRPRVWRSIFNFYFIFYVIIWILSPVAHVLPVSLSWHRWMVEAFMWPGWCQFFVWDVAGFCRAPDPIKQRDYEFYRRLSNDYRFFKYKEYMHKVDPQFQRNNALRQNFWEEYERSYYAQELREENWANEQVTEFLLRNIEKGGGRKPRSRKNQMKKRHRR